MSSRFLSRLSGAPVSLGLGAVCLSVDPRLRVEFGTPRLPRTLTCGSLARRLLVKALVVLTALGLQGAPAVEGQTFPTLRPTWFHFDQEYIDGEINNSLRDSWFTGYELWPALTTNTEAVVGTGAKNLTLFYPAAGGPGSPAQRYFDSGLRRINPAISAILAEQGKMAALTARAGSSGRVWWNVMPEWDGLGGHWIPLAGNPFTASTRAGMYSNFRNYVSTKWTPLWTMLQTPQATRGYWQTGVTDYVSNVHYAYEWGLDMVMLERAIDEVGDIATGVAFLRGAAAQYNKPWGIEMSTWRTSANSNTSYDQSTGKQTGGFSAGYHKRHAYIAYMSGANKILYEATVVRYGDDTLNPLGVMMQAFGAFAVAHPTRGTAVVPIAVMLDFNHGFVPRHWLNTPDRVWYLKLPYSAGDWMVENVLNVLYPGYQNHGLTLPGYSWSNFGDFQKWILAGNDPRPYEPMPNSTYGDLFDVLLSNAPIQALDRYKVVMFAGDIAMTPSLRAMLTTWVTGGGVLVVSSPQVSSADQALLGVTLAGTNTSGSSRWLDTGTTVSENAYTYRVVTPTAARVLATNPANNQPLITMNSLGAGKVYFVAANYMQDDRKVGLLNAGITLLTRLAATYRRGWVNSADVYYLTTVGADFTTVTVVNNSGSTWSGIVSMNITDVAKATEWLTGATLAPTTAGGVSTVSVSVPAWDVRVFALTGKNGGGGVVGTPPARPTGLRVR